MRISLRIGPIAAAMALAISLCFTPSSGQAQDRRWDPLIYPSKLSWMTGFETFAAFEYISDGFLPDEAASAQLMQTFEAAGAGDGTFNRRLYVGLLASMNLRKSFPRTRFSGFLDWGLCRMVSGNCDGYVALTDTLNGLSRESFTLGFRPATTSAQCYDSLDDVTQIRGDGGAVCRPFNMDYLVATGLIPLETFRTAVARFAPQDLRLVLRLKDDKQGSFYVTLRMANLADDLFDMAGN